jgi:hypothetical protein
VDENKLSKKKDVGRSDTAFPFALPESERKAESPVEESRHSTSNRDPLANKCITWIGASVQDTLDEIERRVHVMVVDQYLFVTYPKAMEK